MKHQRSSLLLLGLIALSSQAYSKTKPQKAEPKNFSFEIPNLVMGKDQELTFEEDPSKKFQHSGKALPPFEELPQKLDCENGAYYPAGEELYFVSQPDYEVNEESIEEKPYEKK